MADSVLSRIPVVAGVAYIERVRRLPPSFTATLAVEPDNRYFRHAIAVLGNGEKVGYVAPEIAAAVYDSVKASAAPLTCPARLAARTDHETSGVEILLDFSALALPLEA
jgi:hypothetical protein